MKLINNHHTKILRKSTLKFVEDKYPFLLHNLRMNRVRGIDHIQYLFFCMNIDNIIHENIILEKYDDVIVAYFENKQPNDKIFQTIYEKRPKFICLNNMSYKFKEPFEELMRYILV